MKNLQTKILTVVLLGAYFYPLTEFAQGMNINENDFVKVSKPEYNETIASPYTVKGEAKGSWFYDNAFPIKLFDEKGNLVAETMAKTKEKDFKDTDFVSFEATLEFWIPKTELGTILLEKGRSLGSLESVQSLSISVRFSENIETQSKLEERVGRVSEDIKKQSQYLEERAKGFGDNFRNFFSSAWDWVTGWRIEHKA